MKITYSLCSLTLCIILFSCAPVLNRTYMQEGEREVSFQTLRENPGQYQSKLFILGGVIVHTKFTEAGYQIEAMHVPVDRYGYFEDTGRSEGRFLALANKDGMMPDPIVYQPGRRITLAGESVGTRKGKIDEMEYVYPIFRIKQIYLWPKERRNYPPPYYYEPWFYPYPYYYRYPWWKYPYYSHKPAPPPSPIPVPHPRPRMERNPEKEREHDRK